MNRKKESGYSWLIGLLKLEKKSSSYVIEDVIENLWLIIVIKNCGRKLKWIYLNFILYSFLNLRNPNPQILSFACIFLMHSFQALLIIDFYLEIKFMQSKYCQQTSSLKRSLTWINPEMYFLVSKRKIWPWVYEFAKPLNCYNQPIFPGSR